MEYAFFLHVCSGTFTIHMCSTLAYNLLSIMCGNALFVGVVNAFESVVFMHYM